MSDDRDYQYCVVYNTKTKRWSVEPGSGNGNIFDNITQEWEYKKTLPEDELNEFVSKEDELAILIERYNMQLDEQDKTQYVVSQEDKND